MKQKTHSGAKKRAKKTGSGKIMVQKASNSHRLNPKNKRQKNLAGNRLAAAAGDAKNLKKLLN
jgi:large subunit ribosomal protein L35